MDTRLIDELAAICERHVCNANNVPEAYVPHIPDGWEKGVLVVAEAQNLSKTNSVYVQKLIAASHQERIRRLQLLRPEAGIGVQPWDDGILPLAIEAALKDVDPEHVAVSNAVPWSLVTPADTNANPTPPLKELAKRFWKELLATMRPSHVVAAGEFAREVFKDWNPTVWALPSQHLFSPLSMMVNNIDHKTRFGEVEAALRRWEQEGVLQRHPEWQNGGHNRVLYACLAVWASDAKSQAI